MSFGNVEKFENSLVKVLEIMYIIYYHLKDMSDLKMDNSFTNYNLDS